MIIYYDNQNDQITLKEKMEYTSFEGLEILQPVSHKNQESIVTVGDQEFEAIIPPMSS